MYGGDITSDGGFLYLADGQPNATQGVIRKVNLTTGQVVNISYPNNSAAGAWDLAIAANGLALADSQFAGSGWVPLEQIDLATDAVTPRSDHGAVRQNTQITRSADPSKRRHQGGRRMTGYGRS